MSIGFEHPLESKIGPPKFCGCKCEEQCQESCVTFKICPYTLCFLSNTDIETPVKIIFNEEDKKK